MSTTTFTVADPRTFEGDPYEAAERACRQIEAMLKLAEKLLPATRIMVRNAEMERHLIDGDARPMEWEEGIHGRRFDKAVEDLEKLRQEFAVQAQAAGFNPKARV